MNKLPALVLNILAQFVNNREIYPRKAYADKDFGSPEAMFDHLCRSVSTPQTSLIKNHSHPEIWDLIQKSKNEQCDSSILFEFLSEVLYTAEISDQSKEMIYSEILDFIHTYASFYDGHLYFQDYKPNKYKLHSVDLFQTLDKHCGISQSEEVALKDTIEELWDNYGAGLFTLLDEYIKPDDIRPEDPTKWIEFTSKLIKRAAIQYVDKEPKKEETAPEQFDVKGVRDECMIHPAHHALANHEMDIGYREQILDIMRKTPLEVLESGLFDSGIIRKIKTAGSPALQYTVLSNEFHHKFGRYAKMEEKKKELPTFDCGPTLEHLAQKGLTPAKGFGGRHYDEPMVTDEDVLKSLIHFPALFDLVKCTWPAAANTKILTVNDFVDMYNNMSDKDLAKHLIVRCTNLCNRYNTHISKFKDLEEYRLFVAEKTKEKAGKIPGPVVVMPVFKQETHEQREAKMKEQNKINVFRSFLRFMQNELTDDAVSDLNTAMEILEGEFTTPEFWEFMDKYAPTGMRYMMMGDGMDQDLVFHVEALFSAHRMQAIRGDKFDLSPQFDNKDMPQCQCPSCKADLEDRMVNLVSEAMTDELHTRMKKGDLGKDQKAEQMAQELMSSFASELTALAANMFGPRPGPGVSALAEVTKDLPKSWREFEKQKLDKAFDELIATITKTPIKIELDEDVVMAKRRDLRKGSFLDVKLPLPVCDCERCKAEGRGSEVVNNAIDEISKMMEEMLEPTKGFNPGFLKANDPDFRNALFSAMNSELRERLNYHDIYFLDSIMEPGMVQEKEKNPMKILKGRELVLGEGGRDGRFFMFDPATNFNRLAVVMGIQDGSLLKFDTATKKLGSLADKIIAGEVDYQESLRELQDIGEHHVAEISIKDLLLVIAKKQGVIDIEKGTFDAMSPNDFGSILKYKISLIRQFKADVKLERSKKKLEILRKEMTDAIKMGIASAQKTFMTSDIKSVVETIKLDKGNFAGTLSTYIDTSDTIPQIVSTFVLARSKNGPVGVVTEWSTNDFVYDPKVAEAVINHIFKDQA